MSELPETIWAWLFHEGKRDDLMKGGWNDAPDRREVEYRRADLPLTQAQLMADPRAKALVEAATPFYAAVFNDNGDVTISAGHISTANWLSLGTTLATFKEPEL